MFYCSIKIQHLPTVWSNLFGFSGAYISIKTFKVVLESKQMNDLNFGTGNHTDIHSQTHTHTHTMTHTGIVVKEKQLPLNLQCLQREKK